jgi:hypothetical protein
MGWPIILTAAQSAAVTGATRDFSKTLEGEARGVFAIVLSQMERGVSLDFEEQELVRGAILSAAQRNPEQHIETAYFKLYGVWPVRPTWWERERADRA